MTKNLHPTNKNWSMFDPALFPPPRGVNLLLINEGGCLIIGPWYKGAQAWAYKPVIPTSVKTRLIQEEKQHEIENETTPESGPLDPR